MDVLNTPFNAVLAATRDEIAAHPAAAHFVAFHPETRAIEIGHVSGFDDVPSDRALIYRCEGQDIDAQSFREAWNQAKTDVLRNVEKSDKRFAHLG